MFNAALANQVAAGSGGPVSCTSTHISDVLWDAGDYTWNGTDWDGPGGASASTLGPAIGGWNTDTNRPTDMHMTLNLDDDTAMTLPVTVTVELKDDSAVVLGTMSIVLTEEGPFTKSTELDWTGSTGTAYIDEIVLTPSDTCNGPRISCIQFIGADEFQDVTIVISSSTDDVNLKDLFEATYDPAVAGDSVEFIIASNSVYIGSSSSSTPAIDTDIWDEDGIDITLKTFSNNVSGAGGDASTSGPGDTGGTALLAQYPINLEYEFGTFSGGGGGGAGTNAWAGTGPGDFYKGGGGGGAGNNPGAGAIPNTADINLAGANGTATTGGAGGAPGSDPNQPFSPNVAGGDGGDLGDAGEDASDVAEIGSTTNTGGPGGYSIDGYSLVTEVGTPGTLVGATNP